jgi:divalent metal cation (Fe/Co/Zn/Cd) transporter
MALTALGHLLFYDACGAFICVAVDVGTNFEVWKRSSLRYPFGLERAEVLAGMGMSVMMLFEGLDLVSHGLTHALENTGGHEAHHSSHEHEERISPGSVDFAALSAIISTLVSALVLKNHARMGKVMRFAYIESLPSVLSNPSHFLTLSCSVLLLSLPMFSQSVFVWIDRALSFGIAAAMVVLGVRLGFGLGKMLLMSYSGPGVDAVIHAVQSDPSVSAVDEAKFWQVHYGLCQANLRLRVRSLGDVDRLRERIVALVKSRLGGGYGSGGQRWEVSTQLTLEKD